MSARGTLRTHLSTLPGPVDVDRNERLIQAVIAEALREAANEFPVPEKHLKSLEFLKGVDWAASQLRRRADEVGRA